MPASPAFLLASGTAALYAVISVLVFIAQHPFLAAAMAAVLAGGTYSLIRLYHRRTVRVWDGPFSPFAAAAA